MLRYTWISPEPGKLELIETDSHRPIASIIKSDPNVWHWLRKSLTEIHGVSSAEGTSTTLLEAKLAIVDGLRYG